MPDQPGELVCHFSASPEHMRPLTISNFLHNLRFNLLGSSAAPGCTEAPLDSDRVLSGEGRQLVAHQDGGLALKLGIWQHRNRHSARRSTAGATAAALLIGTFVALSASPATALPPGGMSADAVNAM